jgi:hypothetical protein
VLTEENFKFSPQKLWLFFTACMQRSKAESKQKAHGQTIPVANLVRNSASGNYYARIRLKGKLIWKSLKTDDLAVAELRLGDVRKEEGLETEDGARGRGACARPNSHAGARKL